MLERVQGLGILISRATGEESHEEAIERVTAYRLIERWPLYLYLHFFELVLPHTWTRELIDH